MKKNYREKYNKIILFQIYIYIYILSNSEKVCSCAYKAYYSSLRRVASFISPP